MCRKLISKLKEYKAKYHYEIQIINTFVNLNWRNKFKFNYIPFCWKFYKSKTNKKVLNYVKEIKFKNCACFLLDSVNYRLIDNIVALNFNH